MSDLLKLAPGPAADVPSERMQRSLSGGKPWLATRQRAGTKNEPRATGERI